MYCPLIIFYNFLEENYILQFNYHLQYIDFKLCGVQSFTIF